MYICICVYIFIHTHVRGTDSFMVRAEGCTSRSRGVVRKRPVPPAAAVQAGRQKRFGWRHCILNVLGAEARHRGTKRGTEARAVAVPWHAYLRAALGWLCGRSQPKEAALQARHWSSELQWTLAFSSIHGQLKRRGSLSASCPDLETSVALSARVLLEDFENSETQDGLLTGNYLPLFPCFFAVRVLNFANQATFQLQPCL